MQLAAKDLVHPMNSDHILGKTSLQNKPMVDHHAKNIQVLCRGRASLIVRFCSIKKSFSNRAFRKHAKPKKGHSV